MGEAVYLPFNHIYLRLGELRNYVSRYDLIPKRNPVTYVVVKRGFDFIFSIFFLLLFFPFFALAAVSVRLTSNGPIFYKSYRVGLCGKPFLFIKFRTMYENADQMLATLKDQNEKTGPIFKIKKDPRITGVGRFLRRYSIDELPQLLNVFAGSMSLVGPRPPIPNEVLQYDDRAIRRLTVKPGLTCYWQVMGRSDLSFEKWLELDLEYINEMSLWVDLKILLLTPMAVLRAEGAY